MNFAVFDKPEYAVTVDDIQREPQFAGDDSFDFRGFKVGERFATAVAIFKPNGATCVRRIFYNRKKTKITRAIQWVTSQPAEEFMHLNGIPAYVGEKAA